MDSTDARRFGRPAVSCSVCRKRKLKCDREFPCSNCLRSRSKNPREECIYKDAPLGHRPRRRAQSLGHKQQVSPLAASPASTKLPSGERGVLAVPPTQPSSSLPMTTAARLLSAGDRNSEKPQAGHSEEQLPRECASPAYIQARDLTSHLDSLDASKSPASETIQSHRLVEHGFLGETVSLAHSTTHKSRLFGQSHWITVVAFFRDLVEMAAPHLRDDQSSVVSGMRKCKALAKGIKSRRAPAWPTPPTAILPSRDLADELVDAYLRTIETVYRIVHVPSFRRDYEALWLRATDAPLDRAFLVQLKLVLAIGATTYDARFSLRPSAVTWIYEAQTYLSEPNGKSRLGLQSIQTNILLLIAREVTGIDDDSVWVSAGALVRSAMHIGMHKDPTTLFVMPRPRVDAEIRRRLWNTILELALQSSLASGKPPLISLNDFDTRPPSNFDDDQLMTELEDPVPKPDGELTQMLIPIMLRKTFPLRLEIARLLNDPGSQGTYDETLKLDTELRTLYKDILQTLQPYNLSTGATGSRFDTCVLDVIMHRYIASLHVPFLGAALRGTAYAYSRRVVVDSALRIWYAANSSWPSRPGMTAQSQNPSTEDVFSRFTLCGSGFFRTAAFLASLIIAAELKAQLQEEASLWPVILRPDLLAVLEDSKPFSLRCIQAGETNVKGYLFSCLVASQIEGLKQCRAQGDLQELIVKAAEDAVETCLQLLEKIHGNAQGLEDQTIVDTGYGMFLNTPFQATDDWDFLMSDALLNPGNGVTDPWN